MLVQTGSSNYLTARFDFGVPLEDIFPSNGIHPRLAYLFNKAFETYKWSGKSICTLENSHVSIETCLELKRKLVYDANYHKNIQNYHPKIYFWVLRHFFGLLPLPLLPTYTNGIWFDWHSIANECLYILRNPRGSNRNILDHEIMGSINMLPLQNRILLQTFIDFLKKICISRNKFYNRRLYYLAKYFSQSLLCRPYRPGIYMKNSANTSLIMYLCMKSNVFFKHLVPKNITSVNIPSISTNNTACQTDYIPSSDKNCQVFQIKTSENNFDETLQEVTSDLYKFTFIDHESLNVKEASVKGDDTLYQTAFDFTLQTGSNVEKTDWSDIVKETMGTVKKVEENYIYDDYDTFSQEEYNQVGVDVQDNIVKKVSKFGWTYTPSLKRSSTPKKSEDNEVSYVKYPDVSDEMEIDLKKVAPVDGNICVDSSKARISEKLFQNSPISSVDHNSQHKLHNKDRSNRINKKGRYVLKRIRLSIEFLRTLSPRSGIFKRVKYQRMRTNSI
ncbi:uncharacterized protein LOC143191689 [Rhynchophorus ferrugineus]|uniref:uncharacterized protein LOC143191689 n=1 Tax=Rhynchophorus ferrugineus TaxID=354439 RepID=UPI003FCDCB83